MSKFSFRRERRQEFKHIAHGLIPAASIAPKPAVPRTPPPRSPDPSPERPRSALAAAILSSSLTGQTWAIPLARPRTFSESEQSESFISEPNINKELYTRDRWSDDLASRPRLSSPDHSEEELEDKEEEIESEEDREDHIYQTLDRGETRSITEAVYALPLKPQTRTPQPTLMSGSRVPSPDFSEETSIQTPEANSDSSKKKASVRKSSGTQNEDAPSVPPILTTDRPSQASQPKNPKNIIPPSPESSKAYSKVQKEVVQTLPAKARMADDQKLLEERLQRLEQEISHSQASSNLRSSAGSQAELQNLRRHAQELVDENDALKLTVHRLNVELNRYQTRFRPLSKQESSKISGLPKTGSPPPWLLDMKYLSPLMLAYEDRINEKDALLQTTEEDVKRLRLHVEEVIKENERLHDVIAKTGAVSQKDCHQLQQQAFLVLQENQVLIDQLKAQHVKAKANYSRHHSEVSKVTKQLMLLEAQKQRLQEDLEESRRQMQENMREVKVLQARLKDAVTWDEHCNIVGKLRGQLEQQEKRNKSRMDELLLRVSSLQEESRRLALDKANLTADIKRMEAELELTRQANRKAERRMSVLKRQREKCVLKEEKTRHYLGAIISVAELISQERDQLLHMSDEGQTSELHTLALVGKTKHLLEPDLGGELTSECLVTKSWPERPSKAQLDYREPAPCGLINCRDRHQASVFQHEKQGFLSRILHGTVRFGKLQEEVKVYRRQASTRLAVLEEAAEGRTASYQREILHLQRLLRERQEAEERLLQSKRDIEEELEVVWQAATKENQQMKKTLLDSRLTADLHGWPIPCSVSPGQPSGAPDETTSSTQHQPQSSGPALFTCHQSPGLQRRSVFKSDSDQPNNSSDEKHKHGLDFYC